MFVLCSTDPITIDPSNSESSVKSGDFALLISSKNKSANLYFIGCC